MGNGKSNIKNDCVCPEYMHSERISPEYMHSEQMNPEHMHSERINPEYIYPGRVCSKRGAVNRLTAVILILILIMLAIIAEPAFRYFKNRVREYGCGSALATAREQISYDYLYKGGGVSAEETKEVVTYAMLGWDDLCPAGGTCYIVPNTVAEPEYTVVCGLHDKDKKQACRLNASYVFEQLQAGILREQELGNAFPESFEAELNGKKLTVLLTDEETGFRHGTKRTNGVKGTVAYYMLAGHSSADTGAGAADGEIIYFSFADENYCANWSVSDGWTGDSYDGVEIRK